MGKKGEHARGAHIISEKEQILNCNCQTKSDENWSPLKLSTLIAG